MYMWSGRVQMKKSEAKILLYLDYSDPMYKYGTHIGFKLDMDYGYVIRTLGRLSLSKLIERTQKGNKNYYILTPKGKLKLDIARAVLSK